MILTIVRDKGYGRVVDNLGDEYVMLHDSKDNITHVAKLSELLDAEYSIPFGRADEMIHIAKMKGVRDQVNFSVVYDVWTDDLGNICKIQLV